MSDVAREILESRIRKATVKNNVAAICQRHPSAKGDYRILCYYYYKEVCGIKMPLKDFNRLRECPGFGVIERRFRELRAEDEPLSLQEGRSNKYLPSPGTVKKRWTNESVYHDYYSRQAGLRDYEEIT